MLVRARGFRPPTSSFRTTHAPKLRRRGRVADRTAPRLMNQSANEVILQVALTIDHDAIVERSPA
jgi:hypothetical protein